MNDMRDGRNLSSVFDFRPNIVPRKPETDDGFPDTALEITRRYMYRRALTGNPISTQNMYFEDADTGLHIAYRAWARRGSRACA